MILVEEGGKINDIGFGFGQIGSAIGFVLLSYTIYDLIYVTCFYKNGRAIVTPTLLGIIGFIIILFTTTLFLPMLFDSYYYFFSNIYSNYNYYPWSYYLFSSSLFNIY